ncbi:alphabet [Thecamonas trahens ATCC 50062]|uniref:Alphabet n=1 Tax=Thecamonas trahens ATCC 50062 TaxID=461836 RepID=A0A0L0D960_THETB|nr:alphabet [Thecamonas trahens ATCC 50062]KNC48922.1 alphabet [Thecamonas trahens ATCC 50062]|eukprot:XP_013758339.1 alphabet [Thecamonas trahens ATCC 50062]
MGCSPSRGRQRSLMSSSETVECFHSHLRGRRDTMEDRFVVNGRLHETYPFLKRWLPGGAGSRRRWGAFAVFDGHGGSEISELCAKRLLPNILTESFVDDVDQAMENGFLATDQEALEFSRNNSATSGAAVVVVFVLGSMLFVGHCGDALAVLSRDGSAVLLTEPHTLANDTEALRVKRDGNYPGGQRLVHPIVDTMSLGLTRAIGDVSWKDPELTSAQPTGLIATPQTRQEVIYDSVDEFILVACDGLWDVFSPQEAVTAVKDRLQQGLRPQEVVDDLVTEALRLGSTDNITLIMVML